MARYVKSISFYNRAALVGEFNSVRDDAELNGVLDDMREAGAEIVDIKPAASGGFFKYVLTYVIVYDAPAPV